IASQELYRRISWTNALPLLVSAVFCESTVRMSSASASCDGTRCGVPYSGASRAIASEGVSNLLMWMPSRAGGVTAIIFTVTGPLHHRCILVMDPAPLEIVAPRRPCLYSEQ